jgi:hypothetical protein
MRKIFFIATTFILIQVCLGLKKDVVTDTGKNNESFSYITDTTIRKEIATFSIKGASLEKVDSLTKSKMIEIPLLYCTDSLVYFTKGSTYIHIYLSPPNGKTSVGKVNSIFFVLHSHYLVRFPDSAFAGIYRPNLCQCDTVRNGKRKKNYLLKSPYYKIFQSQDNGHMYVYMVNGEGDEQYEVTWIVKNSKYYGRVLDPL